MSDMTGASLADPEVVRRGLRGTLPAWCVLALALWGTVAALYVTHAATVREARSRFETEIAVVQLDLTDRLRAYEQVLRGGVSAFHSWPSVTRENWRRFVANLHITENYRGIQGIGFAKVVPAAEKAAHISEIGRASCRERVCQYV